MKVKIFSFLFVLLSLFIIWKLNIFSIDTVKVVSLAECVSSEEINKEINLSDKNSLFINRSKIKNNLINKFSCIKDLDIKYEFPRTINVIVYERKFLAKVQTFEPTISFPDLESSASSEAALIDWNFPTESSEDALIIDETGYIFTKVASDYIIPTIFLTDNINISMKLDEVSFTKIDQIFSKILTLEPISYQPNFKAKKYGDALFVNASPKIVFSLEKDILKQLASLQLILQKAKIDERTAEFIDLRFDKPVLQYHSKSSN